MSKLGVWLVGARGGVATTALLGMVALRRGLMEPWGLTTTLPEFAGAGLVDWSDLVAGGHDIRQQSLVDQARELAEARVFDRRLVDACAGELEAIDREIRPGTAAGSGTTIAGIAEAAHILPAESPAETIRRLRKDWDEFRLRHGLQRMVVVNVASTEPSLADREVPATWPELEGRLEEPGTVLPPSVVYAIAALGAGIPHVNFTPSTGSNLAALRELASSRKVCHAGRDGKTGETLLKSVLAPMFARRHLEVLSWVGHNLIGNMDGRVLDDPANKATKVHSKDHLLREILGYPPQTHVSIEYIRSLGDWKTAWDHIHFRGFLGTPMAMQFTWQGCDSILAAPLVLDLVRLVDWASRQGETGELDWLGCFFKSPQGCDEHDFSRQFGRLLARFGLPENGSSLPSV